VHKTVMRRKAVFILTEKEQKLKLRYRKKGEGGWWGAIFVKEKFIQEEQMFLRKLI